MKIQQINQLVRPNILALKAYSSARSEYTGNAEIFLDANENPFGTLNRYPDPNQSELKEALSALKNIPKENIFIGNGSDEVIDVALRIFCNPGKENIIICPPTYGMYEVSARVNDIEVLKINLTRDFQLDVNEILNTSAKIIFICSPNNPTGNNISRIDEILEKFSGIVFVDEAYIDFGKQESYLQKVKKYPNLIVSQTFSKAWGLAAARVGIAYAGTEIISLFSKIKPPYNVSELNQKMALQALQNIQNVENNIRAIIRSRTLLEKELQNLNFVQKVYASDTNFLLVQMDNSACIFEKLIAQKIITRNRNSEVKNCIRITVGTPAENQELLTALKQMEI